MKTAAQENAKASKSKNSDIEILPHRENDPPAGTSTGGPRAAPRQGSRHLSSRRRPRLGISRLASAWAGAPAIRSPLAGSRSAATSQWPRRQGLDPMARIRRGRRLGAGDIPTWRWL